MYSASVDEMDVLVCFFDDQLTYLSPRNLALPDVLFFEYLDNLQDLCLRMLLVPWISDTKDPYLWFLEDTERPV
ncbi:hypothetical protein Tco_0507391 [Tanacetum coccineum]